MNIREFRLGVVPLLLIYVATLAVPIIGDRYHIYLAALFMIMSLFSLSYNILFGYARLLSFGHALFFATGAYTYALFTLRIYEDPLIGLFVAVASSLLTALLIGILTLRHGKIYFSMLTLAFGMLLYSLLIKWRDLTGGSDGLSGIPRSGHLLHLSEPTTRYYFILAIFIATTLALYILDKSSLGLRLKALGVNEDFIPYTGHSVFKLRIIANLISGVVSGLAGALYAILNGAVTPDLSYWTTNAEPLVATLIGGPRYFTGPILGSFIFIIMTTYTAKIAEIWQLVLGAILAALILGSRGGLIELAERLWRRY